MRKRIPTQQRQASLRTTRITIILSLCAYGVGPEKFSVAEVQDKDFKIVILNMLKDIKENINKSLNEIYGNTNSEIKC